MVFLTEIEGEKKEVEISLGKKSLNVSLVWRNMRRQPFKADLAKKGKESLFIKRYYVTVSLNLGSRKNCWWDFFLSTQPKVSVRAVNYIFHFHNSHYKLPQCDDKTSEGTQLHKKTERSKQHLSVDGKRGKLLKNFNKMFACFWKIQGFSAERWFH